MVVGIANNNPWNVKCYDRGDPWKGTVGYDAVGHVQFPHVIFAVRAACRDIAAKYLGGRRTLRAIMERYSPESDTLGSIEGQEHNDPVGAATFIADQMKFIAIDDDIDLFNAAGRPRSMDRLCCFLEALYRQECGWKHPAPSRILLLAGIQDYVRDFVE